MDLDTELNLVTECWVEPQCGTVTNCMEQHRYLQGLKYQEIPQAVTQHFSFQRLPCDSFTVNTESVWFLYTRVLF